MTTKTFNAGDSVNLIGEGRDYPTKEHASAANNHGKIVDPIGTAYLVTLDNKQGTWTYWPHELELGKPALRFAQGDHVMIDPDLKSIYAGRVGIIESLSSGFYDYNIKSGTAGTAGFNDNELVPAPEPETTPVFENIVVTDALRLRGMVTEDDIIAFYEEAQGNIRKLRKIRKLLKSS